MDWLTLVGKADNQYHDSETLKTDLSILFVLERHGFNAHEEGGKYVARCPFPDHADSHPSFDVFGENLERWGCYPCNTGGDVFDLIQRLYPEITRFVHIKDKAAELLTAQRQANWSGPKHGRKHTFNREDAHRVILSSAEDDPVDWIDVYGFLTIERENPGLAAVPHEWIRKHFRIGTYHGSAIVPYYDREMNLVAYKRRKYGEKILAAAGADFTDILYGEWLDQDDRLPVVLCEGESDVWAALGALAGEYAVLGLPTGAGSYPSQAPRLADRDVILAFDGDETGRRALAQWVPALKDANAKSVRIVVMPDRLDLAACSDIRSLIETAVTLRPAPDDLAPRQDGIYRIPKTENGQAKALTNWVFVPKRQLIGTDGDAWEGTLLPDNVSVVLNSHDMGTKQKLVNWSSAHGGSWFGSDTDGQHLQASLQAVRPFLATGNTSTVAGLHDKHFIWPGGSIGPDYWVYDAGVGGVELEKKITGLVDGEYDYVGHILALRALHRTDIMDPIISWLAIAPLRSLFAVFPALAVLGGSGTGKTTLLEAVLKQMTGSEISLNLTSTTPHAIHSFAGSTNAYPVWFDEYRPGAAHEAIRTLDQIVRDAYNGHGSAKGGMGGHWAEVRTLHATAPLIVSGEDAFTETSHVERIVPVYLTPQGKNPEALAAVQAIGVNGWAKNWLETLHWGLSTGSIPELIVRPVEAGLQSRMEYNLGVLDLGWRLLQFYAQMRGQSLPDPDFSGVINAWRREQSGNPVLDAIRWVISEADAADFVATDEHYVYIRNENFVAYVKRAGTFTLPGGSKAIYRYMIDHLNGQPVRAQFMGQQARAVAIPMSVIDQEV